MLFKNIAAILNFWDGDCILHFALKNWEKLGIDVIIVYSNSSNYGQIVNNDLILKPYRCHKFKCEPLASLPPRDNETRKRNYGLDKAREMGYKYFIACDCDEFYLPEAFDIDIDNGAVVSCETYFKDATLSAGLDVTLVPFVHKLTPTIRHEFNRNYPYAWIKGNIRIDPTRSLNISSGVVLREDIHMHHMSWVRKDIDQKINNSTAKSNIERSTIREDYFLATEGSICRYYGNVLRRVPNYFGIDIQTNDDLASNKELLS